MLAVNDCLVLLVLNLAGTDVAVEFRIRETEVVLVGLSSQAVRRCLVDKIQRHVKVPPDCLYFLHRKM